MSDLERAKKRRERMKLLDDVLKAAKDMFKAAQVGGHESWYALAKLKKCVEKVEQFDKAQPLSQPEPPKAG